MDKLKIVDDLCTLYGLELRESTDNDRVYLYDGGYFSNIEIIYLEENEHVQNLNDEYSDLGFSVRKKQFKNIEVLHKELFQGFFNIALSKKRNIKEYDKFCSMLTRKLNSQYSYIKSSYLLDGKHQDGSIVDYIHNQLREDGPQMIILEASAGFGKTCTSYELYNLLANQKDDNKVTILAELSKNRNATVFRYVLLSEINRSFSKLSAELVTSEIKNGNIILIIDGFDELLNINSYLINKDETKKESAQTMLNTISELFVSGSRAKVLLTSRKSSIFTGEIFDEWVENRLQECNVHRVEIETPTIQDWIGKEKYSIILNKNIPLTEISNPILLSYLKNKDADDINNSFKNIDDILSHYFEMLLQRETGRQSLTLSTDEQKALMKALAVKMVEFGISEDSPDFIKDIIADIIGDRINEYLRRYDELDLKDKDEQKPTKDQLYDRLTHHALLDRVSVNKNLIGFINNFLFGLFIGDSICEDVFKDTSIDIKFIDFAVTAYAVRPYNKRESLLKKIKQFDGIDEAKLFEIEVKLLDKIQQSYKGITIEGVKFTSSFDFGNGYIFEECIFIDCIFENCIIPPNIFQIVQFFNCHFYNIITEPFITEKNEVLFFSSTGFENLQKQEDEVEDLELDSVVSYEKPLLEQFWKPGSENAELCRSYITLFRGFAPSERKKIEKTINKLKSEEILIQQIHCLKLNIKKIDTVTKILGR